MAQFPAEEIERIINEEILRGHGNTLWTTPQARRRYQMLLTRTVLAGRAESRPLTDLFRRIIDGHYELAPYCSDRERIFSFPANAATGIAAFFERLRSAIDATLALRSQWPPDALMPRESGEQFLRAQSEQLAGDSERLVMLARTGQRIGLHSERAVTLDQTLQVCRYLLLTAAESTLFDEYYGRAQAMLRAASPLFNAPPDMPVN